MLLMRGKHAVPTVACLVAFLALACGEAGPDQLTSPIPAAAKKADKKKAKKGKPGKRKDSGTALPAGEVCTTIDFGGFQDGDKIGGGPGQGTPPDAHDIVVPAAELGLASDLVLQVSTKGTPGPPAQGSRNQARIFDTAKDPAGWEDQDLLVGGAPPLGPCADCAGLGNILVIEDGRGFFDGNKMFGDSPAGGDVTITGFTSGVDFFLRSYDAVDNEDTERPIIAIGDGTELGRTSGIGNASVETIETDHTTFNNTLTFDYMDASGGVDNIVLCRQTPPVNGDGEGCTPGYWKQSHHFDSWQGHDPSDLFGSVFDVPAQLQNPEGGKDPATLTLLDALRLRGGGVNALVRHAVAALLNTTNADVDFGLTQAQVVDLFNDALATGDIEGAKDTLEDLNERGCDLN